MRAKVDVTRGMGSKPGSVIPWEPRKETVPRRREALVSKESEAYVEWKETEMTDTDNAFRKWAVRRSGSC